MQYISSLLTFWIKSHEASCLNSTSKTNKNTNKRKNFKYKLKYYYKIKA